MTAGGAGRRDESLFSFSSFHFLLLPVRPGQCAPAEPRAQSCQGDAREAGTERSPPSTAPAAPGTSTRDGTPAETPCSWLPCAQPLFSLFLPHFLVPSSVSVGKAEDEERAEPGVKDLAVLWVHLGLVTPSLLWESPRFPCLEPSRRLEPGARQKAKPPPRQEELRRGRSCWKRERCLSRAAP